MESGRIRRFGGNVLDLAAMRLSRGAEELPLEPKSFRLLHLLIQNRDRVVPKEEIFRVVWHETAVTDNALTRSIAQIRKALQDDARSPRFIETIPTVGYRFIGTLEGDETSAPLMLPSSSRTSKQPWTAAALRTGVVLALAVLALAALRLRPARPAVSIPVPLTSYRGAVDAPSFSPDGTEVAFAWNSERQDNVDIYIKTLGPDATPLRLTTDPAPDRWPAWSPDGRTIAFQRMVAPGQVELRTIPALGGAERRLAGFEVKGDGSEAAWSSDGRWLVVCVWLADRVALMRLSVETGEMAQITTPKQGVADDSPALSPDGKTLLFVRKQDFYYFGSLYAVPIAADGQPQDTPRPVPTGAALPTEARWGANGQEILVRSAGGISRIPAAGTEHPQPIPFIGADVSSFDLSRRGNRLAFTAVRGDVNLYRIGLTSRTPQPESLIASSFRDVSPRYSPDGRSIAFQSNRTQSNRTIGRSQVWIADAQGKHERQLTSVQQGTAGSPRWSPDGRRLAFDSNTTGHYQIYTISPEGGPTQQLTRGDFDNFGAAWSRDGQWIYFSSKRTGPPEIWRMTVTGADPVQITRNGGQFGAVSADGQTLYYAKTIGSGSIWQMPLAGGPEIQLSDSLYRGNFALTGRGIYFMTEAGPGGTSSVRLYSFDTRSIVTVLKIKHPEYGLDVSPDGRYLLYAQLDDPGSDLMLIETFQ